jgi:hypothetical protein
MFDTKPSKKGGTVLYQTANRLAMLRFLEQHGKDDRLVYLLFVSDPRSPTGPKAWEEATADVRKRLGLNSTPSVMAYLQFPAVPSPFQFILQRRSLKDRADACVRLLRPPSVQFGLCNGRDTSSEGSYHGASHRDKLGRQYPPVVRDACAHSGAGSLRARPGGT